MMYKYKDEKPNLFTDDGQRLFLHIRDKVNFLLSKSGAVTMEKAIYDCSGDTWEKMACVDRMVELNEIREIPQENPLGQHRIFIKV